MSHKISLRLIGNMEYKHRVFVCVISYSIQQFHLIKHSSPLVMESWTSSRPDGSRSLFVCFDYNQPFSRAIVYR